MYTTHSSSLIKCWSSPGAIHGFFMFHVLSLGGHSQPSPMMGWHVSNHPPATNETHSTAVGKHQKGAKGWNIQRAKILKRRKTQGDGLLPSIDASFPRMPNLRRRAGEHNKLPEMKMMLCPVSLTVAFTQRTSNSDPGIPPPQYLSKHRILTISCHTPSYEGSWV